MGIKNNQKKLNFWLTVGVLISGMIGSAIFSLSGLTISYAGPASIISWILAALILLVYGIAMAELATTYGKNGGNFVFPQMAFEGEKGSLLGFLSVWGSVFADIISVAFSAMYVGRYLGAVFSNIMPYVNIIVLLSIIICYILNIIKFTLTGKINTIFVILIVVFLLVYTFVVLKSNAFKIENLTPFFTQGSKGTFGFLRAVPIAMVAYMMVTSISNMAGEIENQEINIPKSVYVGMFITAALYVFVVFSTVGAITSKELESTDMTYIPLFAVCFQKLSHVKILSYIVSFGAVVALISTMMVVIAMSSRNIKAVADRGLLPKCFMIDNKNGVPIVAITIFVFISAILSQFQSIIEILINLGALFAIIVIFINSLSLIYTRKYKKGNKNHFNAPFNNIFLIVVLILISICYLPDIINGGKMLWIVSISWYLIGFTIYKVRNGKIINKN